MAPFSCFPGGMGRTEQTPKRLAEKLRHIREALGLSQREMAQRLALEVSDYSVSKYEQDRRVPPIELILAYARAANVSMEQIVDDALDLTL